MAKDMSDTDNGYSDTESSPEEESSGKGYVLSLIAIGFGVIALGLASIPTIAFNRPLPNPFVSNEKKVHDFDHDPKREGGITFKFKKLSFNIRGEAPKVEKKPEPVPELKFTNDPLRWFTISAMSCALLGLIFSSIGHVRERHTALTVSSMGCCAAAMAWQYVVMGIIIGAAAIVFLILLSVLGSALG